MSDIQEYKISINFSTKNADKAKDDIDKVKKSVGALKGTTAASKLATAGIGKLTSSFGGLTKMLKGFVAVKTFKKLGETIFSLGGKMADYIETVNLFRASMGEAASAAEEFIADAEGKLGLDNRQLRDSISQFYNLAQGIGIADDRAYTMSKNLTQLAGDLSSFANISFETAQQKLMSGMSGQVKPLREYGIALDQATLQEKAYALGINEKVKNMTRAQKTELIYYQIMSSTQKMQGDLGRSLLSPANSIRVMQTEFKALARAVGSIFIPIMMKIIPVVRAVTQILTQAAKAIANFFGFEMTDFNADLGSVGNLLSGVSDDIGGVGDSADDTAKKLNKMLMPFDELNNVSFDTGSSGSGAGVGAGIGDGGSLGIKLPEYDMFASMSESMDTTINKIKDTLKTLFEPIQNSWDTYGQKVMSSFEYSLNASSNLMSAIGGSFAQVWMNGTGETTLNIIFNLLSDIFTIIGNIKNAFAIAWENNGTGTQIIQNLWDGFNNLLSIIESVGNTIKEFTQTEEFKNFANAIMGIIKNVSNVFKTITEKAKQIWDGGLKDAFSQLLGFFARIGEVVGIVFEKLQPAIQWLLDTLEPVLEGLGKSIGGIIQILNGVLDFIIGVFTGDWERAWDGVGSIFDGFRKMIEGIWDAIGGVLKGIWDFIYKYIIEPIGNGLKSMWEGIQQDFTTRVNWINEHVIEPIKKFFSGLQENISKIWDGIKNGISEKINNIKSTVETTFNTIREKITGPIEKAKEIINTAIEKIKGFFKFNWEFPKLKTPHISWGTQPAPDWIGKILRAINLPDQIPKMNVSWYAEGGFPEMGELFFMNEAGPEMIGQIGNRTAVANQDQITTAIANATYNAISRALAENRSNDQPAVIQVNLGNEQLYKGYGQYKNEQSNMYGISL